MLDRPRTDLPAGTARHYSAHMMPMISFLDPSLLLFAGLAITIASVPVYTVAFRTGSPAAAAGRMSLGVTGIAGVALMAVGANPLLMTGPGF